MRQVSRIACPQHLLLRQLVLDNAAVAVPHSLGYMWLLTRLSTNACDLLLSSSFTAAPEYQ